MNKLQEWFEKKSIDYFDKPTALTWVGWRKWHEQKKKEQPFMYFLLEELPSYLGLPYSIKHKLRDIRWFFKRLVNKDYRHNIIYTGLDNDWHDADTVILYANFSILEKHIRLSYGGISQFEDYVNALKAENHEGSQYHVQVYEKIIELYDWWKYGYQELNKDYDKLVDYLYSNNDTDLFIQDVDLEDFPDDKELKKASDKRKELESSEFVKNFCEKYGLKNHYLFDSYKENLCNEKLKELIDVRQYLWY